MVTQQSRQASIFDAAQCSATYQPIVDLSDGQVVAAEALARWPGLSIAPEEAFAKARREGRVGELDELCQRAALAGVAGVDLPEGFRLFVNVEPGASVVALTERSGAAGVIAEITERALVRSPAELLSSVRHMRAKGCGIALDDVGAVPESLALLPFICPDVVKLDLSLVQGRPTADQARILTAVAAYAERSGASIVAEGIETQGHLDQALALGATLGQGWYFSRPAPLESYPALRHPIPLLGTEASPAGTPFGLVEPRRLRLGSKGLLLGISRHIEQQGMSLETPPVVLSTFQDGSRFTLETSRRYRRLAERCPLVVALGTGLAVEPVNGVRGAHLGRDDRLRGEWSVVIVSPHYSVALLAQDLGDEGPDLERRFLFALTHDHETVLAAASLLLSRVAPLPAEAPMV